MTVHTPPPDAIFADGRSLAQLIKDFAGSGQSTNITLTAQGLTAVGTWIGSRTLRYFVYNAAGFGNQANTVNLMKRMLALGFVNDIELIYDTGTGESMTVLQKLAILLPGLDPKDPQPYKLGPDTTITFFPFEETKNPEGGYTRKVTGLEGELPLCINGGSEMDSVADQNVAQVFKVDFYLQVQPYMWEIANASDRPKSLILAKDAETPVDLAKQPSLQEHLYSLRAFAMPAPSAPNWPELMEIPATLTNRNSIGLAKVIADNVAAEKILTAPIYGLVDKAMARKPVIGTANNIAFQLISATALAQSGGGALKKPIVLSMLNDLQAQTWQDISSFFPLAGEPPVRPAPPSSSSEEDSEDDEFGFGFESFSEEFDETLFNVQSWCYQQGLVQPNPETGKSGRMHILPNPTPEELTALLAKLTDTDVVVLGAPLLPQDAFNYLYAIAGLPSVFEGQGTANLALNLGRPFFKLNSTKFKSYPSDFGNGGEDTASTISSVAARLEDLTYDNIQLGYYDFGSGSKNGDKVRALAATIREMVTGANGYAEYFTGLEAFFGNSANDKLLQALVFLVSAHGLGRDDTLHRLRSLAAEPGDGTEPLDKLYAEIEKAINRGVLALIPTVIPDGPVAEFLVAVVEGKDFDIGSADSPVQVSFPASRDKITVTGRTSDFLGIPLETSVVFTMNANGTDIDTAFSLDVGEVSLTGVQWFKLSGLTVEATIPGNDDRMHGTISSKIELGGNPVSFDLAFPSSADGRVVIDGDLTANPPSLNDLFQLLGGMNFVTTLPPQISSVGNIALHKVKFGYDFKASRINSFELTLENNESWPLFGKLTLDKLAFNIGMIEPTGARRIAWKATTVAVIGPQGGSQEDYGSIKVVVSYPNLTVTAGLNEDGPPIPVGDLVTFFLPADYTINLAADVANFDMTVKPGEKGAATIYQVSGGLKMDAEAWRLSLGIASFALTDVYVEIEGQSGGKEPAVTGSLTAGTVLSFKQEDGEPLEVPFRVVAAYRGDGVWFFSGTQGDQPIRIKQIVQAYLGDSWWTSGLPNMDVTDLAFTLQTPKSGGDADKATSYMVGGSIRVWDTPLGDSFETTITGKFGRGPKPEKAKLLASLSSRAQVPVLDARGRIVPMRPRPLLLSDTGDGDADYGVVSAEIIWNNIELTVYYNYEPEKRLYGFTWGALHAEIDSSTDTATMTFREDTSLGAMVETFISWLTGSKFGLGAPWNLLDKIKLSGFELIWNFKTNEVEFKVDVGPIDLIFAKVDSFKIKYQPKGADKGVHVTLGGSFPWMAFESEALRAGNSTDELGWNAANPSETPAPPGGGNKYFDLRLLAAGQHIEVKGLKDATSVPKAIEILGNLPVPDGESPPQVNFDAGNNWMFATDFGILKVESAKKENNELVVLASDEGGAKYTFTLQIVFTDPTLYALRIALDKDAPAAKIFAGLDFQIMYRKLGDGLGVFSAEITLPVIMRRIDVGAVTITLPTFGVEIYTNGDFQFDIGFPWNEDFARSFSVEAVIPPGIPVLGSGGFYFGKLPAVAVDQLPKATNGFFNPNLVFGFGAQVGLGKSIELGVLRAGFSLTVFGIIEGIIAKWNPSDKVSTGGGGDLTLDGEYFFWLRGTFGVLGHLYGTVDFVVVKASVDIRLKVYVQITLASYEPIPITVSAEVTASASVSINLGLFKIKLSFSFSVKVTETFEIGYLQDPANAPWQVPASGDGGRLLAPAVERMNLRSHNMVDAVGQRLMMRVAPDWSRLLAPASGEPLALTAYLGFGLTVAGDMAFPVGDAPDLKKQFPAYVASLFIEGPGTTEEEPVLHAMRATDAPTETSFDLLAKMVARWAVAAAQTKDVTPDEVDDIPVSDEVLAALIDALSDAKSDPMPITSGDVDQFLDRQFRMTASLPTEAGEAEAAYFPMPMGLTLKAPAIGSAPAYDYSFGGYNEVAPDFIGWLRDYFDQLAVQVQQESGGVEEAELLLEDRVSVASFIQGDYFVLVMRQMLQGMREGLRDFKYPLAADTKPNTVKDWVNNTGKLREMKKPQPFSLYDLFKGNENLALSEGKALTLPYVTVAIAASDSFTSLSDGQPYDATALATQNADVAGILRDAATLAYDSTDYVISGAETLSVLAARIGITLDQLLGDTAILTQADVLQPLARLTLPPHAYTTQAGDTLSGVASAHGITVQDLAGVPRDGVTNPVDTCNGDVAGLFDAGSAAALDLVYLPQFPVRELLDELQRTGAISHLSGMVSRYYMHGLRLPTAKITPLKEGMWVSNDGGTLSLPEFAGLYALTGQQVGIEALPTDPLTLSLAEASAVSWMDFAGGVASLDFTITPPDENNADGDENYQRLKAVFDYARAEVLPAGPKEIVARAEAGDEPARYPLSASITWQSAAPVPFPTGNDLPTATQPRIWPLPRSMVTLSGLGGLDQNGLLTQPSPAFTLEKVTTDQTTGLPVDAPMQTYGWASYVEFVVKKLPETGAEATARKDTYEITGASVEDTVILERIVQYVTSDSDFASLCVGFRTASSSTGEVLRAEAGPDVSLGISQSNLSTTTRPPGAGEAMLVTEPQPTTLLNPPTELVRLLWEASITRAGGFFLYYFDKTTRSGLPDSAFNDKGEATLNLVVQYTPQVRLQPWMNAVATGDAIDSASTNVVARTVSAKVSHQVVAGDSLAAVAARYTTNVLSIVETTTTDIALADKATLRLVNGVYQVPLDGSAPGGNLDDIAGHFAMSPDDIKAANPRVPQSAWDNGLPDGTAIRLPESARTIGTDPGGSTLQSIAGFYGTSAAALAGANAGSGTLLAVGLTLELMTGPLAQHGAQAPGVQPVQADRAGLPDVPESPSDPDYAADYLLNDFTLLSYRIEANADFAASNLGLPLSAQGETTGPTRDKVRFVREMTAEDDLTYKTSIPYVDLAKDRPAGDNPYDGNGRLLQLSFGWNDLYGNLMVTGLNDRSTATGRLNGRPSLTGYTDNVIGVAQWPSISSSWTVAPDQGDADRFAINVELSFDAQPYLPDDTDKTEAWKARARAGLQTVTAILDQLTDPGGIEFSIDTSLVPDTLTVDAAQILPPGDRGTLTAWLTGLRSFLQTQVGPNPVKSYDGAAKFTLSATAKTADVPAAQVFELSLHLTIARTGGVAEGDFAAISSVRRSTARIAPLADVGDKTSPGSGDRNVLDSFARALTATLSVKGETELTVATGTNRYAPAAGVSQSAVWAVRLAKGGSDSGISYSVNDPNAPEIYAPEPVSNTLINRAASVHPYTALDDYDPATNTFTKPAVTNDYSGVDADTWVREFFAFFDTLLSPEYSSSILVVDKYATNKPKGIDSFLTSLAKQKKTLAGVAANLMAAVYEGQSASRLASAREALHQSLLDRLSNLYSTRAAISFGATVSADIPQRTGEKDPQLYGNLDMVSDPQNIASLVTLTSPKMPLVTGDDQPITFLLEAPQDLKVGGDVVSEIELDLRYVGAAMEHQIAAVPGVAGDYYASSWLSPVAGVDARLSADLGRFTVPILLRGFPATPRMAAQSGVATLPDADKLSDLTKWSYGFTYGLDFHYEQDRVYGTVRYNIADSSASNLMELTDAFQGLAQFITYQSSVVELINENLPQVTAATTDQTRIDNAALALGAFLKMATDIALQADPSDGAAGADGLAQGRLHIASDAKMLEGTGEYQFYIDEGTQSFQTGGDTITAWVVTLVSVAGAPPPEVTGTPGVDIAGYSAELVPALSDVKTGKYAYAYTTADGAYLKGDVAQTLSDRKVVIPGLQILEQQDAISSVYLTQNENVGGKINTPFVYTTPSVSFGNPYHPTITSSQVVPVSTLETVDGKPSQRSLEAQLTALFTALFRDTFSGVTTIQMDVAYDYAFTEGLDAMKVDIPVAVLPPMTVDVGEAQTDDGPPPISELVKTLTHAIKDWSTAYGPSAQSAALGFRLTIMSDLTENPMPLLNLTRLVLEVEEITPPLPNLH
jgi:LysM repeat protein